MAGRDPRTWTSGILAIKRSTKLSFCEAQIRKQTVLLAVAIN